MNAVKTGRTVKQLAQDYAEILVLYHVAQNSLHATPESNRRAYTALCTAQTALNEACQARALSL